MTRLLISSGNGPGECRMAVVHILRCMARETALDVVEAKADKHGPASALVTLSTAHAAGWWRYRETNARSTATKPQRLRG